MYKIFFTAVLLYIALQFGGAGASLNADSGQEVTVYYVPYVSHIPYTAHTVYSPNLWEGEVITVQYGSPGKFEFLYRQVYVGGVLYSSTRTKFTILAKPIPARTYVGTAQLGELADTYAPEFTYARRVRMEATAYTAAFCCTGRRPGDAAYRMTASGRMVEHGIVAVDRSLIPFGTRLYVEGYGFAIAADSGGAIRGYKIDLFMESLQDARQFGRRHIYVWIL